MTTIDLLGGLLIGAVITIICQFVTNVRLYRDMRHWRSETLKLRREARMAELRKPRPPAPATAMDRLNILPVFDPPVLRPYPVGRDDTQPMHRVDGAT